MSQQAQGSTFASASPAGEMALAFYLGCLWPVWSGIAPHDQAAVLVALGIGCAMTQLVAGIINLHKGNIMGNIMVAFSIFMWYGALEHLGKVQGWIPHNTMVVDGVIFGVMGLVMVILTIPHFTMPKAFTFFMIFTDGFFVPASLFFLTGNKVFKVIAGWDLPIMIIACVYCATGIMLNTYYGKEVMPMGKPFVTRA